MYLRYLRVKINWSRNELVVGGTVMERKVSGSLADVWLEYLNTWHCQPARRNRKEDQQPYCATPYTSFAVLTAINK